MAVVRRDLESKIDEAKSSQFIPSVHDLKLEQKDALYAALGRTIPATMPVALHSLMAGYLLPVDIEEKIALYRSYREGKVRGLTPAQLGKELLNAFYSPYSKVAFALDDLTDDEKMELLRSPDFPLLLKFYYFSEKELSDVIDAHSHEELKSALFFGLVNPHVIKKGEPEYTILRELYEASLRNDKNFLKREADFVRLCSEYPSSLIHNAKIRYVVFIAPYLGITEILNKLIKQSSYHINLPNANLTFFKLNDLKLSGANLKRVKLSAYGINLDLSGADLRGAIFETFKGFNLRGANLIGSRCRERAFICWLDNIAEVDFLDAVLDKENKESICKSAKLSNTPEVFRPIVDYFNEKYNVDCVCFFTSPPSWDLFVHVLRITRAQNAREFEMLVRDIPKELTKEGKVTANPFNKALRKVLNNFLKLESMSVSSKAPRVMG